MSGVERGLRAVYKLSYEVNILQGLRRVFDKGGLSQGTVLASRDVRLWPPERARLWQIGNAPSKSRWQWWPQSSLTSA